MRTNEVIVHEGDLIQAEQAARKDGQEAGFRQGQRDGYRLGRCSAALGSIAPAELPVRDVHVLYVTAGIGVPYPALDQAIINALTARARAVTVAAPSEDVAALAKKLKPDLVLVLNGVVFPAEQLDKLRRSGFKTAVWFTDDPYYTDWTNAIAPRYHYVFTLELNCLPFYRKLGCQQVYYLPFAADPNVFYPRHVPASYQSDICFIGTAFWNRVELIDALTPLLMNRKVVIAGWWWDRLQNYAKLADNIKLGDWMTPEETASYYNGAKIVINLHRSVDDHTINANGTKIPAISVNPRTFEISGCGTLQLSDIRKDMDNVYRTDSEIGTYTSVQQLSERIQYYLDHDEERHRLAMKGLIRTRQDHTYDHRLHTMLEIIFPL